MIHASAPASLAERQVAASKPVRLDLDDWRRQYGVIAGITGAEDGFDLALWGENPSDGVMHNWLMFRNSFDAGFKLLVVGHQVHGTTVAISEGIGQGLLIREGVDGHATATAGVLLTVLVADCVPVYLLDPGSMAIVLLHAGWRGTAAGILAAGVNRLESFGGVNRGEIIMHCGVSVCGDCYEVGPEVIQATTGSKVDQPETLDLRGVLVRQAARLGIGAVTTSPWCTVHDVGLFHSFRSANRSGGRMAAYLGVPLS